jgi:hypothetical protein
MDIDVVQLRSAAAERRQGRRWQPVDERRAVASALVEGRSIPTVHNSWSGPEFNPPASLGEWLDDRLTERTWAASDPATEVVFAITEAMRESPDAAVTAVRRARALTPLQQYLVFATLTIWRSRNFMLADPVLLAVVRQWAKLRLAEQRPEDE